jgi:hypothetical protein
MPTDKTNNEYKDIILSKKAEILKVGNILKEKDSFEKWDQAVSGNPQYVVEYVRDIVSHLRHTEVTFINSESQHA